MSHTVVCAYGVIVALLSPAWALAQATVRARTTSSVDAISVQQGAAVTSSGALEETIRRARETLRVGTGEERGTALTAIYESCRSTTRLDRAEQEMKEIESEFRSQDEFLAKNAHVILIKAYLDDGKTSEALAEYRRMVAICHDNPKYAGLMVARAQYEIGRSYAMAQDWRSAIAYFKKAEPPCLQIGTFDASLALGKCYKEEGNLDDALTQLREKILKVFEAHPDYAGKQELAEALFVTGQIYELQRKPEDAVAAYRRVSKVAEENRFEVGVELVQKSQERLRALGTAFPREVNSPKGDEIREGSGGN